MSALGQRLDVWIWRLSCVVELKRITGPYLGQNAWEVADELRPRTAWRENEMLGKCSAGVKRSTSIPERSSPAIAVGLTKPIPAPSETSAQIVAEYSASTTTLSLV